MMSLDWAAAEETGGCVESLASFSHCAAATVHILCYSTRYSFFFGNISFVTDKTQGSEISWTAVVVLLYSLEKWSMNKSSNRLWSE